MQDWATDVDHDFADALQNCHDEYAGALGHSDSEFITQFKISMHGLALDENIELYDEEMT